MWSIIIQTLEADKVQKIMILESKISLTFRQFFVYLKDNKDFRNFFIQLMKQAPFEAYFWETPPLSLDTLDRPFEFVFYKSNRLKSVEPEIRTFQKYFETDTDSDGITTFPNLGGDAILVVPLPTYDTCNYAHLAAFVQNASDEQQHKFWQSVSNAMSKRINKIPVWLSTSGLGVYWLHMRLDNKPKYYQMKSYKKI